jgi:hypothetical protein
VAALFYVEQTAWIAEEPRTLAFSRFSRETASLA